MNPLRANERFSPGFTALKDPLILLAIRLLSSSEESLSTILLGTIAFKNVTISKMLPKPSETLMENHQ